MEENLSNRIENLKKIIFSIKLNDKNVRDKSLQYLLDILDSTSISQLQAEDPTIIIGCVISIFSQYDNFWYKNSCKLKRKKKFHLIKLCYIRILRIFIPTKCKEVVKAVINALDNEKFWQIEDLCFEIIWDLIESGAEGSIVANTLCDKIEEQKLLKYNALAIIRNLYELLNIYKWPDTEETVIFIKRLLNLYHSSLNNHFNIGSYTKGFELCIRYIIKQISNSSILIFIHIMCFWTISKDTKYKILNFSKTLEYAAYMHKTNLYENSLTKKIFPLLIKMIRSSNHLVNLLGNRVFQYLIDRGENRYFFNTPKIFFQNAQYQLKSRPYQLEDKAFLKKYREDIHECLLISVMNHYKNRINLETTFCTICLIAIEIPCGFTAASLVCLAMTIQEKIMKYGNFHQESTYHVHALIISIMSLLCWIHQAEIFYEYVNKIILERAELAPYLNPPIKFQYNFASHHIRYEKPKLFFVDWEVRYGLWKRFRLREDKSVTKS